ncbi:MAG: hypothetical protein NT094_05785 [Candidatus Staskawiczbacteria bacterium]|nr:hypothetical protein [Candidatus Staskawiczbacteria bacterium]
MVDIKEAKRIMGKNFIGLEELKLMLKALSLQLPSKIPNIPFSSDLLKKRAKKYVLILGINRMRGGNKITLNNLRSFFGTDPNKSEPCFYNQDWYLKEKFANNTTLLNKWYLVRKDIVFSTRGQTPERARRFLSKKSVLPSAILTAFTFFAYYFKTKGEVLWKNDFIWCSDLDHNGDRIYTGRYVDPNKINKNGFNIHRHLSIRSCYGCLEVE